MIEEESISCLVNRSRDVTSSNIMEGEDETALLKYLIPYFLNDDHDLLIQTHGVSLELARVDGYKLGMALKPARSRISSAKGETLEKQHKRNTMISFQITMSFTHVIKKL